MDFSGRHRRNQKGDRAAGRDRRQTASGAARSICAGGFRNTENGCTQKRCFRFLKALTDFPCYTILNPKYAQASTHFNTAAKRGAESAAEPHRYFATLPQRKTPRDLSIQLFKIVSTVVRFSVTSSRDCHTARYGRAGNCQNC